LFATIKTLPLPPQFRSLFGWAGNNLYVFVLFRSQKCVNLPWWQIEVFKRSGVVGNDCEKYRRPIKVRWGSGGKNGSIIDSKSPESNQDYLLAIDSSQM
jgi:hypothetical protein